ncbi:HK97 family phage prohead protease [Schleiferilactobacillus perolens]
MALPSKEIRMTATPVTVREGDDDHPAVIEGYALKFNRASEVMGGGLNFRESIDPHALDKTDMRNVVALFNHDQSQVLGRTGVNLELTVDETGLKYSLTPPNTQLGRDLVENIRAGIISQSSFAFTIAPDKDAQKWEKSNERGVKYHRIIRSIDHLYDVSPVTTPAYPDTEVTIGARSLEDIKALDAPPEWQVERDKLVKELKREALNRGLF